MMVRPALGEGIPAAPAVRFRWHRLLATALAMAFVLLFPAPSAQAAGPDDEAYAALATALALVEQAQHSAESERARLAEAAAESLESAPGLDLPWLVEPLRAAPPALDAARARLAAARDAVAEAHQPAADPALARAEVEDLLGAPPFVQEDPLAWLPGGVQAVLRAIGTLWRWLGDTLGDLVLALLRFVFHSAVTIVLAAAALVGIVLLYRNALRSAIVSQAEVPLPAGMSHLTAAEALDRAEEYAAKERYRDACHFLLASVLLSLDERGIARYDPAITNREYLARLASEPAVAAALAPLMSRFDRIWYGRMAVDEPGYRELRSLAREVRRASAAQEAVTA